MQIKDERTVTITIKHKDSTYREFISNLLSLNNIPDEAEVYISTYCNSSNIIFTWEV